jgi:hypothetical protein
LYQVFEEPANRLIRSMAARPKERAAVPEEARIAA